MISTQGGVSLWRGGLPGGGPLKEREQGSRDAEDQSNTDAVGWK